MICVQEEILLKLMCHTAINPLSNYWEIPIVWHLVQQMIIVTSFPLNRAQFPCSLLTHWSPSSCTALQFIGAPVLALPFHSLGHQSPSPCHSLGYQSPTLSPLTQAPFYILSSHSPVPSSKPPMILQTFSILLVIFPKKSTKFSGSQFPRLKAWLTFSIHSWPIDPVIQNPLQ